MRPEHDRLCWACHRVMRRRRVYMVCGECGHAWSKLDLILHDWRVRVRSAWSLRIDIDGYRWHWRDVFIGPRRPSRIYVCPCCAHDL